MNIVLRSIISFMIIIVLKGCQNSVENGEKIFTRSKTSINESWRFFKYDIDDEPDRLIYDERPEITDHRDDKPADAEPTEAVEVKASKEVLKPWIMPTGNAFIDDPSKHYQRPKGNPGKDFPFVQIEFQDESWQQVNLPHDWAINGPFYKGEPATVGGGMGRLPSPGVGWYRKQISITEADAGKNIYLEIEGAMSYAIVWLNGKLVGGWPYGYASWQIDLTPYIKFGETNQLAIRLDNPNNSSRWYPGGGIYRNVWLIKTNKVHVAQWGTFIRTKNVSSTNAVVNLDVTIKNTSDSPQKVELNTSIYELDENGTRTNEVTSFEPATAQIKANTSSTINKSVNIDNPKLWGPPPKQKSNLYVAVSQLRIEGKLIDEYETKFGIRSIKLDANNGLLVNGEKVLIKGVNQHHDLGALGAAFNLRAAQRQLELLREMGVNAIRIAHNPPAPELLELTDRMGFIVVDELYDMWRRKKTPHDFHLIFDDWHEQDVRAWIRRDRNAPSVIMWSTGNEVGEQYTDEAGAHVAEQLRQIANDEDPTRPTTISMNYAKPNMPITAVQEVISLNYQGEGIRNAPAYAHLKGINTSPLYPAFREMFPNKVIISSENAAAFSSRGTYIFPVAEGKSSPLSEGVGGDGKQQYVSAYELYTADFGSSADKVFTSLDQHPYVAGGFVWSGWDYLGEPTPYYGARSSYFGIIDLAGFKKDRFYLYQSRWRPDLPMAHILPHWNWPDRAGKITPVHVFTSGDEAELFLNGKSLGRKKKCEFDYRLRWDDVVYEPGELKVIAYKDGKNWAEDVVKTTEEPNSIMSEVDRDVIQSNGKDLAFVTIQIVDENSLTVPTASNLIEFKLEGPGEIVATDNGDPTDMRSFSEHQRNAFNGLALVIIRGIKDQSGEIKLTVESEGLKKSEVIINTKSQIN